jgi:hypothetical protein
MSQELACFPGLRISANGPLFPTQDNLKKQFQPQSCPLAGAVSQLQSSMELSLPLVGIDTKNITKVKFCVLICNWVWVPDIQPVTFWCLQLTKSMIDMGIWG